MNKRVLTSVAVVFVVGVIYFVAGRLWPVASLPLMFLVLIAVVISFITVVQEIKKAGQHDRS